MDANLQKHFRQPPGDSEVFVRFSSVCLAPHIQQMSCAIPVGAWILLEGANELAKALFLDLCFRYILPDAGLIEPKLSGSDISFLGRSYTTYGNSLLEHLSCGVKDNSKTLMEFVTSEVFSRSLKISLGTNKTFVLDNKQKLAEFDLNEKEYMEIAEANLILQKRAAAIIDTTSDFYRTAIEQGFRHSKLLLQSGKTFFWIVDQEKNKYSEKQEPWRKEKSALSFYFPEQAPATYIN